MTTTTKGFAQDAAISDMYEVEAGKIAQARGKSAAVREFGARMVKAHSQTTDKLKALLAATHPDITPPATVDSRREGLLDDLRGAKDEDFDKRYISQQIDAHNEALILMKGYAKDGDTPAIKAFAAKTASVVQQHLNAAKKLSGELKS
jgi:putative membrane protein